VSHDDAFAAFQARRREREAADSSRRVTWRRASWGFRDHGWSGRGPGGALVFVHDPDDLCKVYRYGRVEVTGARRSMGMADTLAEAKERAAALVTRPEGGPE
jgi:hypothetical protein